MHTRASNCILHVDADSFFASVERAHHPILRDKPVCVVVGPGGCVLAATYDAKQRGITTGMPMWEATKLLPLAEAHYVPGHFDLYAKYSERLFQILRRFSPEVEVASVDEAYMNLQGLCMLYKKHYAAIAREIQDTVWKELGLPVSVGVASTKTLAKIGSKKAKPFGVFEVPRKAMEEFLERVELGDIPGVGSNSEALLRKCGIGTVAAFVATPEAVVRKLLHRPGVALVRELQGDPQFVLETETRPPKSVSRVRSFTPTRDASFLRMHLVHHVLRCCARMRSYGLCIRKYTLHVRDRDFIARAHEFVDPEPHLHTGHVLSRVLPMLDTLIAGKEIRSVGIVFHDCTSERGRAQSLFFEERHKEQQERLFEVADQVNDRYGRSTLQPGVGFTPGNGQYKTIQQHRQMQRSPTATTSDAVVHHLTMPFLGNTM